MLGYRSGGGCAAAALVALLCTSRAGYAEDVETVRFVYRAPSSCPTIDELLGRVRARTSRFVEGEAADAREFRIVIGGSAPIRGTLTVVSPGARPATRTFSGSSCDEVASALSLAIALAIDPLAVASPVPSPPVSTPPPVLAPIPSPVAPPPLPLLSAPLPSPHVEAPPPSSRQAVGALGGVAWPAAPSPLFGLGGFAEVRYAGALEPTFRLGFELETSASETDAGARVFFSRYLGTAAGCAVVLRPARSLSLAGCVRIDVGALRSHAEGIVAASSASRPWIAPGATVALRGYVATGFFIEGAVGITVPLWRDDYRLLPATEVHHVPLLAPLASIAFGHDLP